MHTALDMRATARVSTLDAGSFPILREIPRSPTSAVVAEGKKIDVAALKRDLVDATGPGKKFTRRSLSLAASEGKNPDLLRDILSRGRDKQLTVETVTGLAQVLEQPISRYVADLPDAGGKTRIKVIGQVQAGTWNERPEWSPEDQYEVEVDPPTLPGERFALEMVGHSMDKLIPPGSILECIRVFGPGGPTPEDGDIVIARRTRNDVTETTCKRLEIRPDGTQVLYGDSYRSEFNEPIFAGKPGENSTTDDEVVIIALVDRATRSFIRRGR